ncbi:MAG: low molecular weight phosphotyrosine protein phosphatase [Burkholderiales bacterium]|nr:low molecular weight phosphotyrosine protein phosphatase [Burkholderiales bacterium]
MKKTAILFVCMGNICRSPSAEGMLRQLAQEANLAHLLDIDSAGTHDYHIGDAPDSRSIAHAAKRGVDLTPLRGRQVELADFARFDLILAMDEDNLARLKALCPSQHRHKLQLFMHYAPHVGSRIVPDPYCGGATDFERVLDYCEQASVGLLKHLRQLHKSQ